MFQLKRALYAVTVVFLMVLSAAPAGIGGGDGPDGQDDRKDEVRGSRAPGDPSIRIDGNSDFDGAHGVSSGNGTKDDPYIIKDKYIGDWGNGYGVYIGNTTAHFILDNLDIVSCYGNGDKYYWNAGIAFHNVKNGVINGSSSDSNDGPGVMLNKSSQCTIIGGNYQNNELEGVLLNHSSWNTVISNNISNNNNDGAAQWFHGGIKLYNSGNNTVMMNHVQDNPNYGVNVWESHYNTFEKNEVVYNCGGNSGVYLYSSHHNTFTDNEATHGTGDGFQLDYSHHNEITDNLVWRNTNNGFYMYKSDNNIIMRNTIAENPQRGVYLITCTGNTVSWNDIWLNDGFGVSMNSLTDQTLLHGNNFESNNMGGNHARDASGKNWWHAGYAGGGNYWDDYGGVDNKHGPSQDIAGPDGIGDTAYTLFVTSGAADAGPDVAPLFGASDDYPLVNPSVNARVVRQPFRIDKNADFAAWSLPGSGKPSDPYLIRNYSISGSGVGYALYIGNTTDTFEVDNCMLHNASGNNDFYYWNAGLALHNLTKGTVKNSYMLDNHEGVNMTTNATFMSFINCNMSKNSARGIMGLGWDLKDILIDRCNFTADTRGAIVLLANHSLDAVVQFCRVAALGNAWESGAINLSAGPNATLDAEVMNNTISGFNNEGIILTLNGTSDGAVARVEGNNVTGGNGVVGLGNGIALHRIDEAYVENNTLRNNDGYGVFVDNSIGAQSHSGDHAWFSHDDYGYQETNLTRTFNLTGVAKATLKFWHWYWTESGYDGGRVEVWNGASWAIMEPVGGYRGSGYFTDDYNGASGGWQQAEFDLTNVTGKVVQVRFRFCCDSSVKFVGWLIDDIAIPEIGFFDDTESGPNGWKATARLGSSWTLEKIVDSDLYVGSNTIDNCLAGVNASLDKGAITVNYNNITDMDDDGIVVIGWGQVDTNIGWNTLIAVVGDEDASGIEVNGTGGQNLNAHIHNNYIEECWGPGILVDALDQPDNATAVVTENEVQDMYAGTRPGTGIMLYNMTYAFVSGNLVVNCDDFGIEIYSNASVPVNSGRHSWYAHDDYYGQNTRLNGTFDLTKVSSATLTFWHQYHAESCCDGGRVEVNDSTGWTPAYPKDGYPGTGMWSEGSYTYSSNGWRYAVFDLTNWTGSVIDLSFRFAGDSSVDYHGWYVDDISIPEIGFFDDVESGQGSWRVNTGRGTPWTIVGHQDSTIVVSDNNCTNNPAGINVTLGTGVAQVHHNIVRNAGMSGIVVGSFGDLTADVHHNDLFNIVNSGARGAIEVNCTENLSVDAELDIRVRSNTVRGIESDGIRVDVNGTVGDATIAVTDNEVSLGIIGDYQGSGIVVANGTSVTVTGNKVWDIEHWGLAVNCSPRHQAHSGVHAWHSGDDYPLQETYLIREFNLTAVGTAWLTFWHWYQTEGCCDGGHVQVNNGSGWVKIVPEAGYPGSGYSTPDYAGKSNDWEQAFFNLSDHAGKVIELRFLFGSDSSNSERGWYVDDIAIPEIGFFDDVESGRGLWRTRLLEGYSEWSIARIQDTDALIADNNVSFNKYGMWLSFDKGYADVSGNKVYNNSGIGMLVEGRFDFKADVNDNLLGGNAKSVAGSWSAASMEVAARHNGSLSASIGGNVVDDGGGPGIFVRTERGWDAHVDVHNNTVTRCEPLLADGDGIYLQGVKNSTVRANNVSYNGREGIKLRKCSNIFILGNEAFMNNASNKVRGIYSIFSDNLTIRRNIVSYNGFGVRLSDTDHSNITMNIIRDNSGYGLDILGSSEHNYIYANNFVNNGGGGAQGWDSSLGKLWNRDYPTGGNYWSDYSGTDTQSGVNQDQPGSDGFGDTPHTNIDGTATAEDTYPLMTPVDIYPGNPSNLKFTKNGTHFIAFSWSAPSSPGIVGYDITASESGGPFTPMGIALGAKYNATGLPAETEYTFRVRAFDEVPRYSGYIQGTNWTLDDVPPEPPVLSVDSIFGTYIKLRWTASPSTDVKGYKVYMNETAAHDTYKVIGIKTGLLHNASGLAEKVRYSFRVKSFDEVPNLSEFSNQVNATTADETPPWVQLTVPAAGAVNVSLYNLTINVTFNEGMNNVTVEEAFGTDPFINGTFEWFDNTRKLVYTANVNLTKGTLYNVTLGPGCKDKAGNAMGASHVFNFTTVGVVPEDTTAPTVTAHSPTGVNVSVDTNVAVTFSEAMDKAAAKSAFGMTAALNGSFSWNGDKLIFDPSAPLAFETLYTVTVGTGAADAAGNGLVAAFSWNFTTAAEEVVEPEDTTAPTVVDHSPTGTGVARNAKVSVEFSEAMDASAVEGGFSVSPGVGGGAFSWSANSLTWTHTAPFEYNTSYTVNVSTAALDLAGNALANIYSWSFTTVTETEEPEILRLLDVSPGPGDRAQRNTAVWVRFSMDVPFPGTLLALTTMNGTPVNGTADYDNSTYTLTFTLADGVLLDYGTEYNATLAGVEADTGDLVLGRPDIFSYFWRFQVYDADSADTDGDGITDGWENENDLDPLDASDALEDDDGDGLPNVDEFKEGTDPKNEDSDGDGYTDKEEVDADTDPNDAEDFPTKEGKPDEETSYTWLLVLIIILVILALLYVMKGRGGKPAPVADGGPADDDDLGDEEDEGEKEDKDDDDWGDEEEEGGKEDEDIDDWGDEEEKEVDEDDMEEDDDRKGEEDGGDKEDADGEEGDEVDEDDEKEEVDEDDVDEDEVDEEDEDKDDDDDW